MPTKRTRSARHRRASGVAILSLPQKFELLIGPGPVLRGANPSSAFASEAERRAAWFAHRATLLARPSQAGSRPSGWWQYEAAAARELEHDDAAQLIRLGVVGDEELAAIHAMWRRRLAQVRGVVTFCFTEPQRSRSYWAERRLAGIPDTFEPDFPVIDDDDEDL